MLRRRHYLVVEVVVLRRRHYLVVEFLLLVVEFRLLVVEFLLLVVEFRRRHYLVVEFLLLVVIVLHFQADIQVRKDCFHNLLHFANQKVVRPLLVVVLLLLEVDYILHLLEVVTVLLGLHFEGNQVHKDYHHKLDPE